MPSFSTLLPESSLYELGDKGPALWSILLDELSDQVVFLVGPRLFSEEFGLIVVRLRERVAVIFLGYLLLEGLFNHLQLF
jgi:hypothetical protein